MLLDTQIFYAVNHFGHSHFLDAFALWLHYATRAGLLYVPFLIGLYYWGKKPGRYLAIAGLAAAFSTYVTTDLILKHLVARLRPYQVLYNVIYIPPAPHSFSFPSGQAGVAFAIAGICLLLYPKTFWSYAVLLFAFVVAWDRIYMGHHFPSDVLAGVLIGIIYAVLFFRIFGKKKLSVN